MNRDLMFEIIDTCRQLDERARDAYFALAHCSEDDNLQRFWKKMAGEEAVHVNFWRKLLPLAQEHTIPQVFSDPDTVLAELQQSLKKSILLQEKAKTECKVQASFMLAYRLEFYMLHPAFASLFLFAKTIQLGDFKPATDYERHIRRFIDGFALAGELSPELELLSESLQRLWHENRQLALQSSTCPLTLIFNRRGFFDYTKPLIHLASRNQNTVGVLMVDIDYFKKVNDTHGHQVGDRVLRRVAHTLESQLRDSDVIGRYGGEEFIILLTPVEPASLLAFAERLRQAVATASADDVPVTISIGGIAAELGIEPEDEMKNLITLADQNLYKAKANGRNQTVLSS